MINFFRTLISLYKIASLLSIHNNEIVFSLNRHLRIKSTKEAHILLDGYTFSGQIPEEYVRLVKINDAIKTDVPCIKSK
jgi:hypothetical protein